MATYCVNTHAQSNGDYEVHDITTAKGCHPLASNRYPLGSHDDCSSAVQAAKDAGYRRANGCAYCAPSCHTT